MKRSISLIQVAYKPKLPSEGSGSTPGSSTPGSGASGSEKKSPGMLDCNSAEWCIFAYLYDLSCNCSSLKSRDKFQELKRLFSPQVKIFTVLSIIRCVYDRTSSN